MSEVQVIIERIRGVAFKSGVARLAREAGIDEDTARRMLKNPPKQISNLIALELAADKIRAETVDV